MRNIQSVTLEGESLCPKEYPPAALCPLPEEAEEIAPKEGGMAKLLAKLEGMKEKLNWKDFPWKKIFNPRNALVASCVALIAVAGYLNVRFSTPALDTPSAPLEGEQMQESVVPDSTQTGDSSSDFFAQAVISRERVRDEAIDVLRELTEDETADAIARQDAYDRMNQLAEEISTEVNIENLVRSKGFTQCVAVVSGEDVNVIVQSEGLTPGEVAQIKEIVYVQTGVLPKNIKIIEKSARDSLVSAPTQSSAAS